MGSDPATPGTPEASTSVNTMSTGLRMPGPVITNRRCSPTRASLLMLSRAIEQPARPND
jgi:hypothetical protein